MNDPASIRQQVAAHVETVRDMSARDPVLLGRSEEDFAEAIAPEASTTGGVAVAWARLCAGQRRLTHAPDGRRKGEVISADASGPLATAARDHL